MSETFGQRQSLCEDRKSNFFSEWRTCQVLYPALRVSSQMKSSSKWLVKSKLFQYTICRWVDWQNTKLPTKLVRGSCQKEANQHWNSSILWHTKPHMYKTGWTSGQWPVNVEMRLQDLAGPKQDENLVIIWVNAMCWQVKTPIYKMCSPTLCELVNQAKAWPKLEK